MIQDQREKPPVLLLDVDGVVNALRDHGDSNAWPADQWLETWASNGSRPCHIVAARPVLDFLAALHKAGSVEVRWHTTWQQAAPDFLAPALGLPRWPLVRTPEFTGGFDGEPDYRELESTWWKLAAAEDVAYDEGRRLVWLDDDIAADARWPGSRTGELTARPYVHAVSPISSIGLTRSHLRSITAFLGLAKDTPAGRIAAHTG